MAIYMQKWPKLLQEQNSLQKLSLGAWNPMVLSPRCVLFYLSSYLKLVMFLTLGRARPQADNFWEPLYYDTRCSVILLMHHSVIRVLPVLQHRPVYLKCCFTVNEKTVLELFSYKLGIQFNRCSLRKIVCSTIKLKCFITPQLIVNRQLQNILTRSMPI